MARLASTRPRTQTLGTRIAIAGELRRRLALDFLAGAGRFLPRNPRQAVVVRVDAIGDFVLWLPFARALAERLRATGKSVALVCNAAYAELAAVELAGVRVIAVDPRRLAEHGRYRYATLRRLGGLRAAEVYHPTYSRALWVGDALVRACGAPVAVGFDGDLVNCTAPERAIGNRWYSRLVRSSAEPMHESRRNAEFLEGLDIALPEACTRRVLAAAPGASAVEHPYFVVAPGAGWAPRQWPLERFAAIARRALERWPELQCKVAGSVAEAASCRALCAQIGRGASVAETRSIIDFVSLIRAATFVVGNESAAAHIAAATDVPGIAIAGGGHFGRFVPYAPNENRPRLRRPSVVHEPMPCYGCNWWCRFPLGAHGCVRCIDAVAESDVWEALVPLGDAIAPRAAARAGVCVEGGHP